MQENLRNQELVKAAEQYVNYALQEVWKTLYQKEMQLHSQQLATNPHTINEKLIIQETNKQFALVVSSLYSGTINGVFYNYGQVALKEAVQVLKNNGIKQKDMVEQNKIDHKKGVDPLAMAKHNPEIIDQKPRQDYQELQFKAAGTFLLANLMEQTWIDCFIEQSAQLLDNEELFDLQKFLKQVDKEYSDSIELVYDSGDWDELIQISGISQEEMQTSESIKSRKACLDTSAANLQLTQLQESIEEKFGDQTPTKLEIESMMIDTEAVLGSAVKKFQPNADIDKAAAEYESKKLSLENLTSNIAQSQKPLTGVRQEHATQKHPTAKHNQNYPEAFELNTDLRSGKWRQVLRTELGEMLENTVLTDKERQNILDEFNIADSEEKFFDAPEILESEIKQTGIILSMLNSLNDPEQRLSAFQEGCSTNGTNIDLGRGKKGKARAEWLQQNGAEELGVPQDKDGTFSVKTRIVISGNEKDGYTATIKIRNDSLLARILRAIQKFLAGPNKTADQDRGPIKKLQAGVESIRDQTNEMVDKMHNKAVEIISKIQNKIDVTKPAEGDKEMEMGSYAPKPEGVQPKSDEMRMEAQNQVKVDSKSMELDKNAIKSASIQQRLDEIKRLNEEHKKKPKESGKYRGEYVESLILKRNTNPNKDGGIGGK